ncbi:MAG: peptidase S10, partial [Gaiellaceae bacterium]
MTENEQNDKNETKREHEPPRGAATTATWNDIPYTATAKWLVLRKKEKPSAEIFSVAYVADGTDLDRPVTFVFNGGPGASSAYLHVGAVGPQRVAFPDDGSLPVMPARLVPNEDSWL